jgi:PTS system nitrogen regulatory IIA component
MRLKDAVTSKLFFANLEASTRHEALAFMCNAAAEEVSNSPERLLRLTLERERVSPSGWHDGLAVPHARVAGLPAPTVVVARSLTGIDFDARDGKRAGLILLILTPDNQSQHDLLSDAGEIFARPDAIEQAYAANTFLELVAALNAPVK